MQYYDGSKLEIPDNLGRLLYDMDKKGFLPNNSIGFNAIDETPDAYGRTVSKWTLHEFSKVNVGMNSGCITMHNAGGKVEFKYLDTKDQKDSGKKEPIKFAESEILVTLQSRFDELMKEKTSPKENKDMENLSKSAEQIAHKACHVLHAALIKDLKAEAEKSGDVSVEAEKIAKKCFKEYSEMALPHVEKYIKAVKEKAKPDDEDDDEDDGGDEKNLSKCGHKIAHKALKMAHKAMIEEIHGFCGKKDTDHEKEAARLMAEHEKCAMPHAKDFVEKWAAVKKEKTFANIDLKSIAANIAHESAQTNMRMIHDGMVSEAYQRAWNDKDSDSETIAGQVAGEAADLHKPHLKCIVDKVRADNPKDLTEYQKKHFSNPATNPAETVSEKSVDANSLPVDGLLKEFEDEQKAKPIPASSDFSLADVASELKNCLPGLIGEAVKKEIRKAQGKLD